MLAKELMLLDTGEGFLNTREEALAEMQELHEIFHDLYIDVLEEEMEPGEYKDINVKKDLLWFEYANGKFSPELISLVNMLGKMSLLTDMAANDSYNAENAIFMLYRNGFSEALTSFNLTVDVYT
jgi:hypothetical protein